MEIGAVLPHNEIGTDRGAIIAYLEGIEDLGVTHLLIYDHVLGADRDRPGGFRGPYDKDVAFHEPLTFFAFAAAVTRSIELVTAILILPQRQTVLVAKQAGIQAQAQYAGGDPDRWRKYADRWRDLGATHLAIATHNAGPTDVDGHLARVAEVRAAVID